MKSQSNYHYAYNSPLTYRDPTGLAPEKEKEGEELMGIEHNWDELYPYYLAMWEENERRSMFHLTEDFNRRLTPAFGEGGGRTGASYTFNGSTTTTTTNSDGTTSTSTTYNYTTHIPTSFGTKNVPTTVDDKCGDPNAVMDAFVGGINDILAADPTYFDGLLGSDVSVNIMNSNEITFQGQGGYAGLHSGVKGTNKSVITLAGDVLTGHTAYPKYPNKDGGFSPHEPYMIIAHEFAHANHFALTGDNFFSYNWQLQELFAITNTNRIQSFYNDPQRKTWSSIRPIWGMFYKSTWWHYQIYGY
jgi:hypothetical protein